MREPPALDRSADPPRRGVEVRVHQGGQVVAEERLLGGEALDYEALSRLRGELVEVHRPDGHRVGLTVFARGTMVAAEGPA